MLRKGFTRASIALLFIANVIFPSQAKAANCTPQITSNGNQTVVAFKTVGTCTWSTPAGLTTFKGLIIGGGGGGGSHMGGGGGGGGYIEFNSLSATSDVFTIVVGDGGAGAPTSSVGPAGTSGANSSISGSGVLLTSRGGAGGASVYSGGYSAQLNGGSGGGAAGYSGYSSINSVGTQSSQSQTPSLSTINGSQFGFDGSVAGTTWYPDGGGGAGGSGSNTPGTGGIGRSNAILGTNYYWAGGGGGSGYTGTGGAGGNGGGGGGGTASYSASNYGSGASGLNSGSSGAYIGGNGGSNTGGGGGGGTYSTHSGGKGGSGIVILSYLAYVGPASISLQLGSSATTAVYRTTSTIEALVDVPGKVTFYQAGKTISGCRNKTTSGSSPNIKATCTWKPSNRGSVKLTARITPSSASYSATTSSIYAVPVGNRTTPR